jgi:acyl-coenzyme A synthetase/AMP-(fatty) acid ligase
MTLEQIPLLTHGPPSSVVAYRGGRPITARQFLADARALAALLPAGVHVLNACGDRYRFAVGLAACLIAGKASLLPPTHVPEVIRHLRRFAPDAVCLTDDEASEIDLPLVRYPMELAAPVADWRVPAIASGQRVAYVFTSGSTGTPVPHQKTWAHLVADVRIEAERLGLNTNRRHVIVATVPPQHMYGFESSVLLALHSGQAFCVERPFYPADIAAVLAAVPAARVLVSTPVHLRALLAAGIALPELELVVCATAPLAATTATEVEARFGAPLIEIYGSTETGQIASRRTTRCTDWQLWPGVSLVDRDGRTWAEGGHVEAPTPLADVVEIREADRFVLRGRREDLVNIGGKRSSIAYLNHQLISIPGVVDGAFFLPEEPAEQSATGTARLSAVVVAPGLAAEAIIRELRERIDPVFLPRPLLMVDRMPRNATGKLPRAVLKSLTGHG